MCPIWRSAAHSHIQKLQLLLFKCLCIAIKAPLYLGDRQIYEDFGIPFFADHIRALTEGFNIMLADARNPLVWQLWKTPVPTKG
jgi:hypothetical protein